MGRMGNNIKSILRDVIISFYDFSEWNAMLWKLCKLLIYDYTIIYVILFFTFLVFILSIIPVQYLSIKN